MARRFPFSRIRFVSILTSVSLSLASLTMAVFGDTYSPGDAPSINDMTSSTEKAAPSGAASTRTTIGLGEKVTCSIDSGSWSDKDENDYTEELEVDTIGDRVWSCSGKGSISPSGTTSVNSVTLTASFDPGSATVQVRVYDSKTKYNEYIDKSKAFTVIRPTGETTADDGWSGATSKFMQTLTPTSVNFTNISVTEKNGAGSSDGCWFAGSTQSKYEALTGGTWGIEDNNEWDDDDYLAWGSADITYYRAQGRAPCHTTLAQKMVVVQGTGNEAARTYATGDLVLEIGVATLNNTRNGVTMSKNYP